ncbi:MAG TPA: hypothetical protein VH518_12475 [Tepidisphaeraceae bacterium]|jgi:hypothetical protein
MPKLLLLRWILLVLLALTATCAAQSSFEMQLKLTLAEDQQPLQLDDMRDLLRSLRASIAPSGVRINSVNPSGDISQDPDPRRVRLQLRVSYDRPAAEANTNELSDFILSRVKAAASTDPAGMTAEQRSARLKDLAGELASLQRKITALNGVWAQATDPSGVLLEKLNVYRQTLQKLEMERAAKEARRVALREGIDRTRKEVEEQRSEDPIASELRKLVKLREEEVARAQALSKANTISRDELAQTDAALSEARIRLAEREASLGKAGKGELLDRLSDELAIVTIDLTELEVQMSQASYQLKRYDPATIDSKKLDELLADQPQLGGKNQTRVNALLEDLEQQVTHLRLERFALKVADVTMVPE